MKRALLGMAVAAGLAAPASAQTVRLDEGTFRILVNGREVGTETFSLRQNGTGADAVVIAQGKVILDSNETTANVQLAGAGLRVVAYDVELSGADARRIWWTLTGTTLRQLTLGLALGAAGSAATSKVLPALLIGSDGLPPLVLAGVAAVLVVWGIATLILLR